MALFGLFVLWGGVYKLLNTEMPRFETIGLIRLLALAPTRCV